MKKNTQVCACVTGRYGKRKKERHKSPSHDMPSPLSAKSCLWEMCGKVLSLLRIPSANICGDATVLKPCLTFQLRTELVLRRVPTHTEAFLGISKQ